MAYLAFRIFTFEIFDIDNGIGIGIGSRSVDSWSVIRILGFAVSVHLVCKFEGGGDAGVRRGDCVCKDCIVQYLVFDGFGDIGKVSLCGLVDT